jgi:hypothetical protein
MRPNGYFLSLLAVLLVAASAATTDPALMSSSDTSFPYGTMHPSCAPWDGPAIEVRLTPGPAECKRTSGPYLSIVIWRGLPLKSGQVVKWEPGSDNGSAGYCQKDGECRRAQSATIVFDKYSDRDGAAGTYELHFKEGDTMKGKFDVKWCEERMFCG